SGAWSTYSSAIDISSYTSVTVNARAVDNVGNISSVASQTYIQPVISSVSTSTLTSDTSATVSATVANATSVTMKYGRSSTDLSSSTTLSGSSNSYSTTLTDLIPGTKYYYQVTATNAQGSVSTEVKDFTTSFATPVVSLDTETANSITIKWDAINGANSYHVTADSGSAVSVDTNTTYTLSSILPNTPHTFTVAAVGNDVTTTSSTFAIYTLAAQPAITTAAQKQNGSVVLTINTNGNGANTRYQIEKSTSATFAAGTTTVQSFNTILGATNTLATVTVPKSSSDENAGVLPATEYYFRIKAENGNDVATNASTTATPCLTVPEIPNAPTLNATQTSGYGAKQMKLTWNVVDGATSYDIFDSNGNYLASVDQPTAPATTATYTDARNLSASGALIPNMAYTYKVVSRNAGTPGANDDGCSVYSSPSSKYTLAVMPDVKKLTANSDGTVALLVEEFDNPDTTEYYVEKSTSPDFPAGATTTLGKTWTNPGTDHILTIDSLDVNTTYYFRIKARNNQDPDKVETAAYGDVTGSILTIPGGVASAPTVTAPSSTALNISWSAVPSATSYDVYYSEDGTTYSFLKNVTGTSTSDTGLAPNTGRQYEIAARNSSGTSVNRSAASTKCYTSAVVPSLTLVPQKDGQSIKVSISKNGNSDSTQYYVEYCTTNDFATSSVSDYSTLTERTITGLTPGTTYYFHVKAKNGSGGETVYSDTISATTALNAPTISSVVPTVDGSTFKNTVTWGSIANATNYNVYRDGVLVGTVSGTSYEDSGLKANQSHSYTVGAVNAGGESEKSGAVSARTLAEYPNAVTVADKTATTLTLKLTPNGNVKDNERYQLIIKNGAATVKTLSWSTDLTYEITGLNNTTEYTVFVNAANSDDVGRGEKELLSSVYCNHDVLADITNDEVVLRSEADGHNDDFAIALKVWDPDGDDVTITATLMGLVRTTTIAAPTTEPTDANVTLSWDIKSIPEGSYNNIDVTADDGYDSTVTDTYLNTLTVDKTAPTITLIGDATVYVNKDATYTDEGANVAGDDSNGLTTDDTVDTATAGAYTVTYTAVDNAGNTKTATRRVLVIEPMTAGALTLEVPGGGIDATSAVVNGTIVLDESQTILDCGYVWSTATIPDETVLDSVPVEVTKVSSNATTNGDGTASSITGLTAETTYYLRPYVKLPDGTYLLGAEQTFTTASADANRLYFTPIAITKAEGDAGTTDVIITVTRLATDISSELTVPITFGGTASDVDDYSVSGLTGDSVVIADGDSFATFTVSILGDADSESDETVEMTIPAVVDYTIVNDTSIITITDDDGSHGGATSSDCDITGFTLAGIAQGDITITDPSGVDDGTITLTVPYGTNLRNIKPDTLMVSDKATVSPSADALRDFSVPIAYAVTAEDGTIARYIVTVSVAAQSSDAELSGLTLANGETSLSITPAFSADTTEYALSVGADVDSMNITAPTSDAGATVTVKVNGVVDDSPDSVSLNHGSNQIVITVRASDGTEMTYTLTVMRAPASVDANADLLNITLSNGILVPIFDKNSTDYNVNVANTITSTAVNVTLSNASASYVITANGATTTTGTEVPLNVGANVFAITVTATDGTIKTYSISVSRAAAAIIKKSGGGGGAVTTTPTTTTATTATTHVPVVVDGETVSAGTQTTATETSGRTTTTVVVDTSLVDKQLSAAGVGAEVTVPISGEASAKSGTLSGDMIEKMEKQSATLCVNTGNVTYVLPADEINIDEVASDLGSNVSLADIDLTVKVDSLTGTDAKFVSDAASSNGYTLVLQPVAFTVTASYNKKSVEIDTFDNYVQRRIEIPEYINPEKITTAVVVTESHTYHVPTEVKNIDGKYYAVINSLTNSTYALIWNPIEFKDAEGHWAKNAINNMGSRTVVSGVGNNNYEPNRNVTRAEFAAIMVRALGLDTGLGKSSFNDVRSTDWYYGYTQTAVGYGIVSGYSNGAFGSNDSITREQAMAMIARAMKTTDLQVSLSDSETNKLLGVYSDGSLASSYARESIAACLKAGVVFGREDNTIAPKDYITRAEVAVMVERLLQKSELI
ncbi:MAG: S-layer homology domain-containing protein, partial [Anaerotignum sp.]|nr:S-layer homology domain-containing protein [Anaerotignum sp.]